MNPIVPYDKHCFTSPDMLVYLGIKTVPDLIITSYKLTINVYSYFKTNHTIPCRYYLQYSLWSKTPETGWGGGLHRHYLLFQVLGLWPMPAKKTGKTGFKSAVSCFVQPS